MKDHTSEDDSSDVFDFNILDVPNPVPVDLIVDIQDLIDDETISIQDILDLYALVIDSKGNFISVLDQVVEIMACGEHPSFADILKLYKENPLHLLFMSNDPDEIILANLGDPDVVLFGIKHYDIDLHYIREELGGDNEEYTASLMDFDRIIGRNQDDPTDEDDSADILGDNYAPDK